jgi:integrase
MSGAPDVSASVLWSVPDDVAPAHCPEDEYRQYIASLDVTREMKSKYLSIRRVFVEAYPDLGVWFAQPLEIRVGRIFGTSAFHPEHPISFDARRYLYFLALTDRIRLDYAFLLSLSPMYSKSLARSLGFDLGLGEVTRRYAAMGYCVKSPNASLVWTMSRVAMRTGIRSPSRITIAEIDEIEAAIDLYTGSPEMLRLLGKDGASAGQVGHAWRNYTRQTRLVLHNIGNDIPRPRMSADKRRAHVYPRSAMGVVIERYLEIKRATLAVDTVDHAAVSLRRFVDFIVRRRPEVTTFAEVTRDVMMDFVIDLRGQIGARSGRPLSITAQRARALHVAHFLSEGAAWEWPGFPTRAVLDPRDLPRLPQRLPRSIPPNQLAAVMEEVRKLACDYQRAAILVARWSGARRREIARLPVNCVDAYPDGTPRLRIPAGKTLRERMVPLHPEAADAIRKVAERRAASEERPVIDPTTRERVKLLFYRRGVQISPDYLFNYPLTEISRRLGFVDQDGLALITAHRFRHTVGTELAEGGARLQTIMDVLGHQSPHMSMVYIRVSDEAVLQDYRAVLKPGATIAGPAAQIIRNQTLPQAAVDWFKSNFLKTELELGHYLRLPEEGPCECDLYLSCAKFVTTRAYAPRLKARHQLERSLAADAKNRGWTREVERHGGIARRIEALLTELGEDIPEKPCAAAVASGDPDVAHDNPETRTSHRRPGGCPGGSTSPSPPPDPLRA